MYGSERACGVCVCGMSVYGSERACGVCVCGMSVYVE